MEYVKIKQIEQWDHDNLTWEDSSSTHSSNLEYKELTNYDIMNNFFSSHIPLLWKNLNLIDIICLAQAYKPAAYTAYYMNYSGFATFCDKAWYENTLDFTMLKNISIEQFNIVQNMFQAHNQIFPESMPSSILKHMKASKSIVFQLDHTTNVFEISQFPHENPINISIHGSPLFPFHIFFHNIVTSFESITQLDIYNIKMDDISIAILRTLKLEKLSIIDSIVSESSASELARSIIKQRSSLNELTLSVNPSSTNFLETTITNTVMRLRHFDKLESLSISLDLTEKTVRSLTKIKKLSNLRKLTIKQINSNVDSELENKIINLLGRDLKIDINIEQTEFVNVSDLEWE